VIETLIDIALAVILLVGIVYFIQSTEGIEGR